MKSQREYHEALCAGKTLVFNANLPSEYQVLVRFNDSGLLVRKMVNESEWASTSNAIDNFLGWEIYEEPSASYDEAVNAKCVRIHWPPESSRKKPVEYPKHGGWTEDELTYFDLAERRGYRMEVVE